MIKLRNHQEKALNHVKTWYKEKDNSVRPILNHCTGSGKSVVIAAIAEKIMQAGHRMLILAHVKELLEQNYQKTISYIDPQYVGIYSASLKSKTHHRPITVAGIQSIYKKAALLHPAPHIIMIDECHMISKSGAGMYNKFINDLLVQRPNIMIIGATATAYRTTGGCLISGDGALFNTILHEYSLKDALNDGYIVPVISQATDIKANLDDVKITAGEFNQKQMAKSFNPELTVKAVSNIIKHTEFRNLNLIFACNIDHAEFIKKILGDNCAIVTGNTAKAEREKIINDARNGKYKHLVNVGVLTTGTDIPNIDCITLLRATASLGLYVQMIGRGLRLHDSKQDCLLLDYGGNIERNGSILHIQTPSAPKKKKDLTGQENTEIIIDPNIVKYKKCPDCGELNQMDARNCVVCDASLVNAIMASHDIEASTLDPMNRPQYVFDLIGWNFSRYKSKKENGIDTLLITYNTKCGHGVRQWVCPNHLPHTKACRMYLEFIKRHQLQCLEDLLIDEIIAAHNDLRFKPPLKIKCVKNNGHFQPIGYMYERNYKRKETPADTEKYKRSNGFNDAYHASPLML